MKNIKKILGLIALFAFVAPAFVACEEDEDGGSKEMFVYLRQWSDNPLSGKMTYDVDGNEVISGTDSIQFLVYINRESSVDVEATLEVDESYVDAYNEENKTSYKLFPSDALISFESSVNIKAGNLQTADSVKVKFDIAKLSPGDYLLPISLGVVKSKDKGIQASTTAGVIYQKFSMSYDNVDNVNKEVAEGFRLDRSSWVITADDEEDPANYPATNMMNGDVDSSWHGTKGVNSIITVDMGKEESIKGFAVYFKESTYYYAPTVLQVYVSEDGEEWLDCGEAGSYITFFSSSSMKEREYGINFLLPVTYRYYRLQITSVRYSYYGGPRIAELNAIKAD